jgi:phage/conjugal plasmid C-4 type zinc finger TraR family protein
MEALLESVEGLGESLLPGELWELIQAEKESITHEIAGNGPLRHDTPAFNEWEPWDDAEEVMQRRHRGTLELRLRELNDAQDRLIEGGYGFCSDCGLPIGEKRLRANPAASLCISCQSIGEAQHARIF